MEIDLIGIERKTDLPAGRQVYLQERDCGHRIWRMKRDARHVAPQLNAIFSNDEAEETDLAITALCLKNSLIKGGP